jgi:hypothetical protein
MKSGEFVDTKDSTGSVEDDGSPDSGLRGVVRGALGKNWGIP